MTSKSSVLFEAVRPMIAHLPASTPSRTVLREIGESAFWGEIPEEVGAIVRALASEIRRGSACVAFEFALLRPTEVARIVCEACDVGPSQLAGLLAAILG